MFPSAASRRPRLKLGQHDLQRSPDFWLTYQDPSWLSCAGSVSGGQRGVLWPLRCDLDAPVGTKCPSISPWRLLISPERGLHHYQFPIILGVGVLTTLLSIYPRRARRGRDRQTLSSRCDLRLCGPYASRRLSCHCAAGAETASCLEYLPTVSVTRVIHSSRVELIAGVSICGQLNLDQRKRQVTAVKALVRSHS